MPMRRTNFRTSIACLATVALAIASGAAKAGRPSVTENADVIERGACEVEGVSASSRSSGNPSVRETVAIFTCAVGLDTQPAITYGRASAGGSREEGLLLGAKTMLRAPGEGRTGLGVVYAIGALKAAGSSWAREEASVTGLLTRELGPGLLGHANLGWSHSRAAGQSTTTWALGLEVPGDTVLAADVFGDDRGRPGASVGAGRTIGKVLLNAAYQMQFETPRVRQFSVGAKLTF
ncbi:MAG: hypothetical protein JNJ89_17540 [Rubrivivax sp.]|nr:hypothetical protein [Rubrivivax sp.]